MTEFSYDDYSSRLDDLPIDFVVTMMITDLRNRISGIVGAEQVLRAHYAREDIALSLTHEDLRNLLSIVQDNSQDIVNILNAVNDYCAKTKK